jgi:hypothetical protein
LFSFTFWTSLDSLKNTFWFLLGPPRERRNPEAAKAPHDEVFAACAARSVH